MPTPTKDEIRKKAIKLFMKENPEANIPEDDELKKRNLWKTAQLQLMSKKSEYEKAEEEKVYLKLVDDCKNIVQKLRKTSEDVIRRWHKLGTRILEDIPYEQGKWGSYKIIRRLAQDIKVKPATIYCAIHFAKNFPDLEKFMTSQKLLGAEKLTWHYIVHKILYEPTPKPPKPKKLKMDILNEILTIADKIDLEKATEPDRLLWRWLVEACYKYDNYDECWNEALTYVMDTIGETGEEADDVRFTMEFDEDGYLVCRIHGYIDKKTKEYKKFDGKFHFY